ncbi:MAG TPA: hypothetical protein VJM33_16200, partial [Microthrixaceae bacterium]|nr:hypothetical protein [Microthrixaceae bacterium]
MTCTDDTLRARYTELGGASGSLGPITRSLPGRLECARGVILCNQVTDSVAVVRQGPLLDYFASHAVTTGQPQGIEWVDPHSALHNPSRAAATLQQCDNGTVFSSEFGTFLMSADLLQIWSQLGLLSVSVGYPIAEAVVDGAGSLQRCSRGTVVYTPTYQWAIDADGQAIPRYFHKLTLDLVTAVDESNPEGGADSMRLSVVAATPTDDRTDVITKTRVNGELDDGEEVARDASWPKVIYYGPLLGALRLHVLAVEDDGVGYDKALSGFEEQLNSFTFENRVDTVLDEAGPVLGAFVGFIIGIFTGDPVGAASDGYKLGAKVGEFLDEAVNFVGFDLDLLMLSNAAYGGGRLVEFIQSGQAPSPSPRVDAGNGVGFETSFEFKNDGSLIEQIDYWSRDASSQYRLLFHHSLTSAPNGGGFEGLGGELTSDPGVSTWGDQRLDVFARGTDNAVWHRWFDRGSWFGWESLGGRATSSPAAVSWGPGRIDMFVRGRDNAISHKWYADGKWQAWESLSGKLSSGPTACSWGPGRLDVFALNDRSALATKWYTDGRWQSWSNLDTTKLASDPAAVSWGPGRIDVFAKGTDGTLFHKWYENGWSGWESLGGQLSSGPAVSSFGPGKLDVFARGTDNALWHKKYDGTWREWVRLAVEEVAGKPAAASWGPGRIDVFATG